MLNTKEVEDLYGRLEESYQSDLDVTDMDDLKYYEGLLKFVEEANKQIRLEVLYKLFHAHQGGGE